uniref:SNF2_N domain-containing protein n=1 Tax=Caenorhabditis tropicalis TaxID=1561998 RepID=A0A1I7UP63_9PELO
MENVAQTKRYSKSEFVRYSRDAMQVLSEDIDIVRTWRALIGNHTILAPNYWKVHRKHLSKCKYFIVDVKDIECLEQTMNSVNSQEERKRMIFRFRSLSSWMQVYENHHLYLRAIPSGHNGIKDAPRVFAEDLLEIIPIVLEKQGMPKSLGNGRKRYGTLKDYCSSDRIEDYRNKWASSLEGKVWITVSTKEMAGLFDDLDCNKELVTIIEDPSHINTSRDVMERGGYIRTISPNQTEVMDTSMAALYIFDTLVKGRNHKKYRCDGSLCGKEDGMDCLKRITKLLNWVMEDTSSKFCTCLSLEPLLYLLCVSRYSPRSLGRERREARMSASLTARGVSGDAEKIEK